MKYKKNERQQLSPYLSIITLTVSEWNHQLEDIERLEQIKKTNKKHKIQQYVAYKRITLALRTHMGRE